ncbi:Uncharacterized protein Fot_30164 [Forsythia ovata]|uniref:Ribonuclease II-like barrel domain-containing protein n=1 Tax=Forsythia ovata TaxID=205694 RepID=A0ABD1TTY5_9LAMI
MGTASVHLQILTILAGGQFPGFRAVPPVLPPVLGHIKTHDDSIPKSQQFIITSPLVAKTWLYKHPRYSVLDEFKKDLERVLLAVVQKPGGKKNWIVSIQDLTLLEFA